MIENNDNLRDDVKKLRKNQTSKEEKLDQRRKGMKGNKTSHESLPCCDSQVNSEMSSSSSAPSYDNFENNNSISHKTLSV